MNIEIYLAEFIMSIEMELVQMFYLFSWVFLSLALNDEDHTLSHYKSITSTHAEHVLVNNSDNQSLVVSINISNFVRSSQSVPNNSTQLSHDREGVIEETRDSCSEQSDQCDIIQTVQVTRKCHKEAHEKVRKESLLSDKKKKKWNTRATKKVCSSLPFFFPFLSSFFCP